MGKQVMPYFGFTRGVIHTIVGIVDNVKQVGLDDEPAPALADGAGDASGSAIGVTV